MESTARLDYVLFHLTPTRTRCDLVIFAGKLNEKLAYGLLGPFIAHLKSAKEQISKGGYSVTLRPPSPPNSHWFTKGTLQRFVRFVSSPEVLERFVTIEREISQLENSVKSYADGETEGNGVAGNAKSSAASTKGNNELNLEPEENSKARLQRVVETRKAVLRKEQAMVYARALAAGYEMDNLQDLLLFSDAFGASRLREACINFKDLCNTKNEDRHWVDEIAAMQAMMQSDLSYMGSSGIILAGEDNDPTQGTDVSKSDSSEANQDNDTKLQSQVPWQNQFHPYFQNFQGPMYQQMPPYQGYAFPGMPPSYYPANMQWPTNANGSDNHDLHDRRDRKSSSKKKGKHSKARGSDNENQDENTEASESSPVTETESSSDRSRRKRQGKKSSRKVVIRNINYISSKRDGDKDSYSETASSSEGDYLDGDSLKQQLEEAVGSFEKHHKSTSRNHKKRNGSKHRGSADKEDKEVSEKTEDVKKENGGWDAFQQLLLKEDSDSNAPASHTVLVEEDYFARKLSDNQSTSVFKPEAEEKAKQKPLATDAFLVNEKGPGTYASESKISDETFEHNESYHSVMKRGGAADEFIISQRGEEPENISRGTLSDDVTRVSMIRSHTSDDWFVSRHSDEAMSLSRNVHQKFVDGDFGSSSTEQIDKRSKDAVVDDSLMMQGRFQDDQSASQLRTDISLVSDFIEDSFVERGITEVVAQEPQSFCEPDELYMVLDRDAAMEQTVPSWTPEMDFENNTLVNSSNKESDECPPSDAQTSEKGPRNKKIGASVTKAPSRDSRSRASAVPFRRGKPEPTPGPRRSTFGSKTTTSRSQNEKEDERIKRIEELRLERQKRIAERSGAGGGHKSVTASLSSDRSKLQSSAQETKKPKPTLKTSTIERLAAAKSTPNSPTTQSKKQASNAKSVVAQKKTDADPKKSNFNKVAQAAIKDYASMQAPDASGEVDDSKDIKELHITSPVINKGVNVLVQMHTSDEKAGNPQADHSAVLDFVKENSDSVSENVLSHHEETSRELNSYPVQESPVKILSSPLIAEEKTITNINVIGSPVISVVEQSTPPPTSEIILETTQSRKKWAGPENSPKSVKGFRKLLIFGRNN